VEAAGQEREDEVLDALAIGEEIEGEDYRGEPQDNHLRRGPYERQGVGAELLSIGSRRPHLGVNDRVGVGRAH
jgi:hypothetical protein